MKISKALDYKEILGLRTDDPATQDPTYSRWWELLASCPLFISYPRTGSHWINAVMEMFFERPRLPESRVTFLDPKRDDWAWFHDHDTIAWDKLHIKNTNDHGKNNVLYLYRNPIDTVFSWIVYNFNNGQSLKILPTDRLDNLVTAVSQQYRDHLNKWLIETPAKVVLRYENFKKDPIEEFSKINNEWYGQGKLKARYDRELAKACFDVATPAALSERRTEPNTLSDFMLTDEYAQDRSDFTKKYGDVINSIVITEELKEFFE